MYTIALVFPAHTALGSLPKGGDSLPWIKLLFTLVVNAYQNLLNKTVAGSWLDKLPESCIKQLETATNVDVVPIDVVH